MRIEYLYRYPVKGLTAEALEAAEVEAGRLHSLGPRLRAGAGRCRASIRRQPHWLQKANFMCQMKNASASPPCSRSSSHVAGMLAIRAPDGRPSVENALTEAGRERIGAFLTAYLGEEARGDPTLPPRARPLRSATSASKVVSLINLASLRDFEAKVGARRHRRRFRANVWFSGAPAWASATGSGGRSRSAARCCA